MGPPDPGIITASRPGPLHAQVPDARAPDTGTIDGMAATATPPRPAARPDDRRGRDVSRLEAFSDAIFGFAATLLVVSLEVPQTFDELAASLRGFVAFGLTFAALVLIWAEHNAFFRRYGLQDTRTVVLNAVLLFVVLFYVYPLKFLASSLVGLFAGDLVGAGAGPSLARMPAWQVEALLMVYSAGWVAIFLCVALLYRHAHARRDALALTAAEAYDAVTYGRHYLIFVLVGLTSLTLAAGGIGMRFGIPGWIYVALGPLCYWNGVHRARGRPAPDLMPPSA
jgi:uncharacterized membrane protein